MDAPAPALNLADRRRALAWGHVNGGLWAAGNALTTGPLVSYLARDLGAAGLGLGLLLATPNLAGLVRLVAPALIDWAGTARRSCLQTFTASYLLILGLPAIAAWAPDLSRATAVCGMIAVVFAHQLLEYLGTVAQWAWWGDLVPTRIRGRYFARRQRIQLAVSIPALLGSGWFADFWRDYYQELPERQLLAYAIPTAIGAVVLLASVVPLVCMPATRGYPKPQAARLRATIAAPFLDRRFWSLLVFRGWFSLANGISQLVQNVIYPKDILGFGVGPMQAMRVVTQVGQFAGSRSVGKLSDRFGNRPVLVAGQACVAASLLFYLTAGPDTRWLLVGAWVLYAAYIAHNICLPNLVLKLSPEPERPAYVAAAEAIGSVFHAASTIGGGVLFDYLRADAPRGSADVYRSCVIILVLGLAMRGFGVLLLLPIREPGAWTWREILAGRKTQPE
jgi:MFS family permease